MISVFVSDIDGCLAEPYRPYDRARFGELAAFIDAAGAFREDAARPSFSICSGRAYPYVEALTQALSVKVPVLFESGGGLFDPEIAQVTWHPDFTDEVDDQLQEVRRWLIREIVPETSMMYDYGKRTQAGIIGPDSAEVRRMVPEVEAFVTRRFPDLCVFHTPVSIDVLARGITKQQGMHFLAEYLECTVEEMAYIGDSNGDLDALRTVGYSFAPSNATDAVKDAVSVVTQAPLVDGVIEAYEWCLAHNSMRAKKAS